MKPNQIFTATALSLIFALSPIGLAKAAPVNLISNPSFETMSSGGDPLGWYRGGWGTNQRDYIYPVGGFGEGRGAQVLITSFKTGDAKWYFGDVPVKRGEVYAFSYRYKSTAASGLTYWFMRADGSTIHFARSDVASTNGAWKEYKDTVTVPAEAVRMTAFVTLSAVGSLTVDEYSLALSETATPANRGSVTFTFDDAAISHYTQALPILDAAGLNATFYMPSTRIMDATLHGSGMYLNQSQMLAIQLSGHEIAGHTRTHPHLTALTSSQQLSEISGARMDLLSMGAKDVISFAYPYGEYDSDVIANVRKSGFTSARTVDNGFDLKSTEKMKLVTKQVVKTTTAAQVKAWVDQAIRDKSWLVLTLHQVDHDPEAIYGTTPEVLRQIVSQIDTSKIDVVTVAQGVAWQNR